MPGLLGGEGMKHQPTTQRSFLFFTIITLVIMTQMVVLRWGPEAVFFATWLFLALTVQHDGRISAAVGLVFLATCPFLLIFDRDSAAKLAANYAYYFVAIGVLVQLEDMLLERYGWLVRWLERKVDLSYLWRPAAQALGRRWSAAVQALERQLAATGGAELVRVVQVVGTTGLVIVFLGAAFIGTHISVMLPLLGGAILFPFLVWGLWLAGRTLGPAWMLRAALALVVLSLAAAEMVWLHNLISADRPARMRMAYDFIERVAEAERTSPTPEGETIGVGTWIVEGVSRRVLYQQPALSGASRIAYSLRIERGAMLAFDVATAPESWTQPGDGVTFAVYVDSERGTRQLFSTYIDPKHNDADRRWHSYAIDVSAYGGQVVTLIFETTTGPAGDPRYDWAAWGGTRLLRP